jgi:alpha-1,2-mannosyltransferase
VYTGDTDATLEHMVEKAQQRFNVDVRAHVHRLQLVYLRYRWLVDARYYPVFTLIGQSIGTICLGSHFLHAQAVCCWESKQWCAAAARPKCT